MMSIQKIKEDLKKKLSSKRYEHTMGVEYTAAPALPCDMVQISKKPA